MKPSPSPVLCGYLGCERPEGHEGTCRRGVFKYRMHRIGPRPEPAEPLPCRACKLKPIKVPK